jgi:hypothetical protein
MLHLGFDLANAFFARDQIPLCFKEQFLVRDPGTRTLRCLAKLMRGPSRFRFSV